MNLCDYYDTYWRDKGDLFDRERLEQMAALVSPGESVLALDCGPGVLRASWPTRAPTSSAWICPPSPWIWPARKASTPTGWTWTVSIAFAAASFDTVLSDSGLEHRFFIDRPLDEAVRVLRPGGRFILSVPNLGHWRCRLWLLAGRFPPCQLATDAIHLRFFTLREAKALLQLRGLTVEATDGTVCLWAWQFYPFWLRWPVVRHIYAWLAITGPAFSPAM